MLHSYARRFGGPAILAVVPCCVVALAAFAGATARAQTLTLSPVAPTTDQFDVFQAGFNTATSGTTDNNRDFTDNNTPGQIFTTGSAAGQQLLSLTVKGLGAGENVNGANDVFGFRVSTISGTTLTSVVQQTASSSAIPNNSTDYVTFTFAAPVGLQANTTYAFDVFSSSGYFGLARNVNGNGGLFNTFNNRGFSSTSVNFNGGPAERTFYANITSTVAVPEPGSVALFGAGLAPVLAGVIARGRRRQGA